MVCEAKGATSTCGHCNLYRGAALAEFTRTIKMESAWLVSDALQAGISLPVVIRETQNHGATALGDLRLSGGYEFLPELEYSVWKPRGFVYLQVVAPTGRSVYETLNLWEQTGSGYWQVGVGSIFLKRWGDVDASAFGELHYGFSRVFNDPGTGMAGTLNPGFGTSAGLSAGWTPGAGSVRIGARLSPNFQSAKSVTRVDGTSDGGEAQISTDFGLDLTWIAEETWTVTAAYTDASLIGPAAHAALSRTFALTVRSAFLR
jgi:hypothetical protein